MELGISQAVMFIYSQLSILQMSNVHTENAGFKSTKGLSCDMIQNDYVFLFLCFRHLTPKMEFTATKCLV